MFSLPVICYNSERVEPGGCWATSSRRGAEAPLLQPGTAACVLSFLTCLTRRSYHYGCMLQPVTMLLVVTIEIQLLSTINRDVDDANMMAVLGRRSHYFTTEEGLVLVIQFKFGVQGFQGC